jgi:glucosyl-dolichyl phosphate glucuronosyltransferase
MLFVEVTQITKYVQTNIDHKAEVCMNTRMNVTVILCTYNRCDSLANALDSLSKSVLPECVTWEILVVDNNSSDQTSEVIESFLNKYPGRIRYLFEPRQGKSFALNSGIREANGDILAFADDDVSVDSMWLSNLTSALYDTQWAGSGGRILPSCSYSPPSWLALDGPYNLLGALCAYFDPGDFPCELKSPPIGTNMAYRKDMFKKYGLFRTDLGPRPDSEIRHEDTEFGCRLLSGGERICYVPSAIVYHEIHERRVCKEFFLAWWFDFGRGSVLEGKRNLTLIEIMNVFCCALQTTMRWALSFDPQHRFYCKCRLWCAAGKLIEGRRQVNELDYK